MLHGRRREPPPQVAGTDPVADTRAAEHPTDHVVEVDPAHDLLAAGDHPGHDQSALLRLELLGDDARLTLDGEEALVAPRVPPRQVLLVAGVRRGHRRCVLGPKPADAVALRHHLALTSRSPRDHCRSPRDHRRHQRGTTEITSDAATRTTTTMTVQRIHGFCTWPMVPALSAWPVLVSLRPSQPAFIHRHGCSNVVHRRRGLTGSDPWSV